MGQLVAKLKDLFGGKKLDLILVGLANAGKSTLLNQLASNGPNPDAGNTIPTIGLNVAKFKKGKVTIKAWDLSGQQRFRDEWKRYTVGNDVIVFVVDSADFDHIDEARMELHNLLEDRALHGIPLVVCANKIDVDPHLTKEEVVRRLNLDYITDHPWAVIPLSAAHAVNLEALVDWLLQHSHAKH